MHRSITRVPAVPLALTLLAAACVVDDPETDETGETGETETGETETSETETSETDTSETDTDTGETETSETETETTTGGEPQAFAACEGFEIEIIEPTPGYPWSPLAVRLVSEEVAPGVFAVYDENAPAYGPMGFPLATSGGFVIGDDGVLLVETMINRQLLCQLEDLVRVETDLPITHAINTSYHGDHSFGNAYLDDDVLVVQHERTAEHIAAFFDEDVAFMEMGFGADQGIAEATPVAADIEVGDDGWSLDLGGVTVEAQYHGFGQTEGDLFVYVPAANVLWTGNPLVAEAPAIPWLLDGHAHDVRDTLATVQGSLPDGAIVVPGHSGPHGADDFDFAVDYLDAMIDGVQAAVDAGLSVEETVAVVTLEPFQGYALWDWVHGQINVPMTHAEFGG